MTKDEALTLALEALELLCVKCRSNEWGPDTPRKEILNWMHNHASKAHTAVNEALAQPEQEPEFAYVMEAGNDKWKKLLIQERNFCQRCGKRLAELTAIHTCTPPAVIGYEY